MTAIKIQTQGFKMNRKVISVVIFGVLHSGLFSASLEARTLDGVEHTVRPGDAVEKWDLRNGAYLNLSPGAAAEHIDLGYTSSKLTSDGATIGYLLLDGEHEIILNRSETGNFSSSRIQKHSDITLDNTRVFGTVNYAAMDLKSANVNINNDSHIKGGWEGIRLSVSENRSSIIIDNSTVEGVTKHGIFLYTDPLQAGRIADITVQNNSEIIAGNGVILESGRSSAFIDPGALDVNFTVDNSRLKGDVVNAGGGEMNVTLRNNASLTGQLTEVKTLTLQTGGIWNLVDDATISELVMNGGTINLSDNEVHTYRTLTAETLAGSGNFMLSSNLGQGKSDKLVISGNATGDHVLLVRNTGIDPETDAPLELVHIGGGGAQFSVAGGAVDVGLWKYYLNQNGNSWALEGTRQEAVIIVPVDPGNPEDGGEEGEGGGEGGTGPIKPPITPPPSGGRELSNSAQTVLALNAAVDNLWSGENAPLARRMYQTRSAETITGMWSAVTARDVRAEAGMGVGYRQSLTGLQIGGDRQVWLNNQPLVLGAFAGYSHSNVRLDGRSSGQYESQYGGAYASWFSEGGWYADALLKADHVKTKANAVMSDGSGAKAKYSQNLLGGQLEVGKKIRLGEEGFVTPFAKFSAMHATGYDASLDNGMKTRADGRNSMQGSLGAATGINHQLKSGGTLGPYVRVAAVQEFANKNDVNINGTTLDNGVRGTRGEVATGVSWQVNEKVSLQAEVDYAKGQQVERNWGGNVSFEYRF